MKLSYFVVPALAVAVAIAGPPTPPPPAPDTACPANASSLITANPWAFQLRTGAFNPRTQLMVVRKEQDDSVVRQIERELPQAITRTIPGIAAIGTFTANPGGTLTATLTTSEAGVIARRATVSGRYIAYPDCSGGEIMIMLNGFAAQLEFVWANDFKQMLFVSDNLAPRYGGYAVLTGNALPAPTGCPAGIGNSVNLLDKTAWSFRLSQQYLYAPGDSSVGTLRPYVLAGSGFLNAVETAVTANGVVTRLAGETGRYQVYGDCSGGEVMIMNRAPGSVQLEFVFAGAAFNEMFLLNDNAARAADVAIGGNAYRY